VTGGVSPAAGMDVDGPDPCWDMDDGDDDFLCGGLGPGVRSVRAGYSLRAHPGFWLRDQ
jgi:hypothetical protein